MLKKIIFIYYFLIISDSLNYKTGWTLGNIFMRKYQFIFNLDSKEIGFYNPKLEQIIDDNNNNNDNDNKNNKNNNINNSSNIILYVVIILILCLLLFVVGLFIIMKFCPKISKKKRVNELDDEYEYVTDKKNAINNDNNDYNIDENK